MAGKQLVSDSSEFLRCNTRLLSVEVPVVMGILNLTPDSFSDGGRFNNPSEAVKRTAQMLAEGAGIIDLGAQSTRPGADFLSAEEEWERLREPLRAIRKDFPEAFISIDTFHAEVAKRAAGEGADLINDVSGGTLDPLMIETVASLRLPYVLMHMRGTPATMKNLTKYRDLTSEVIAELSVSFHRCRKAGIADIIIDPGFGFAKSAQQNFELMNRLSDLTLFGCPLLVGISRKSFIYKTLGTDSSKAVNGTTALHMAALKSGASILRVHDVKEAKECVKLHLELKAN